MRELYYFKHNGDPEIVAALAGISKVDWRSVPAGTKTQEAVTIMRQYAFDVLPIIESNGIIGRCFTTYRWGTYDIENILISDVQKEHRLYFLSHIHDVILKFASTGRKYFFLDNYSQILGLITIGNLNCKHVYLYFYNLNIQLEQALGHYLSNYGVNQADLINLFDERKDSSNAQDAISRFREDNSKGLDYNFLEYIYLVDFAFIYKKYDLIKKLNLSNKQFESIINHVNEVRKTVAHPNRSLIKSEDSIYHLEKVIIGIDVLMEKLLTD